LALTFTNKAAKEMKERIAGLVGYDYSRRLWMGTFHSIFSKILRYEARALGYTSDYTIYDTIDSKNLVKTIIKELKLDEKVYKPGEVFGRISNAKNNLITPENYASNSTIQATDRASRRPQITDIFSRYSVRCKKANAMDFDDLLLNTNILFRDHPEILQKYRHAFQYILVDEYQDTNYSQYLIIKKLSQEHHNICVVGDDAQSIYSFRGARIENILTFQNDYPEARLYKLERNYRSTRSIVDAANSLIKKNQEQIRKNIYSENSEGEKIEVLNPRTDNDEGYQIANIIKDTAYSEKVHYRDFAILYRTNAQSRIFEESLRKMNIPYRVYGGISFFQRKEIKDILAYFKVVVNPDDDESLKRIINYPLRGIGKTTLVKLEALAVHNDLSIWEVLNTGSALKNHFTARTLNNLTGFVHLIRDFREKNQEMEAFDIAYTLASQTGIMKELVADKSPEGISRYENLEELLNGIRDFTESNESEDEVSLSTYLQTVSLYTDADTQNDTDKDHVTIMTVHSAKGLEFKYVFVVGLEEDLFPSHMANSTPKELEEERRLFYVAITRAEKKLYLSYAGSRYKWGLLTHCNPSKFITEIDEKFLQLPQNFGRPGIPDPLDYERSTPNINSIHRKIADQGSSPMGKEKKLIKIKPSDKQQEAPGAGGAAINSKLKIGSRVEHPRFGKGRIDNIEGIPPNIKATVLFDNFGKKQLLLKFAKLSLLE
ncbi:MAG: ATP-dependent helicase, partial [Bacteroidota bacterium]